MRSCVIAFLLCLIAAAPCVGANCFRNAARTHHRSFRSRRSPSDGHGYRSQRQNRHGSNQPSRRLRNQRPCPRQLTTSLRSRKALRSTTKPRYKFRPGKSQQLDIALQIAVEQQHVEVQEEAPTVDVSPRKAARARWSSKAKISTRCRTIPTNWNRSCKRLAGPSAGTERRADLC